MRGIVAFNTAQLAVLVLVVLGTAQTTQAQRRGGGGGGFGGASSEPEERAPIDIEELQRNYPFRSLKKRLEYEQRRTSTTEMPRLGESAKERLDWREDRKDTGPVRDLSLKLLHSDQVEKFVKSEGFGVGRAPPSVYWLPPSEDPGRLKLSEIPASAEGDGPSVELPDQESDERVRGDWSPSKEALLRFSERTEDDFADSLTLGYVKSLDKVAGFEPHAFRRKPELHRWDRENDRSITHDWNVSRLELVSLLKQREPRVYVSEYLPRMQELDEKVTRAVNPFEADALKQLRDGEEVHVEAKLNAIRMVGAIRASKKCIECHQVQRGELLGAFTYELKRVPPLPVPKRRVI
jgi:hypothetical protein